MDAKEQLIHDIVVLQERINFYNANKPTLVNEITKLAKRQSNAIDYYHQAKLKEEWVKGFPEEEGYYDALTIDDKVFIALRKDNKWWGDDEQNGKVLFGLKDDFITHYRPLPPKPDK